MDGDHGSGLSDDEGLRAELEWKRPDCDITFDRDLRVWGATLRMSETSLRYIVGPSLPELQVKLVMTLGNEGSEAG
jgi:hypothetical protein